jgi:hypothetical protein
LKSPRSLLHQHQATFWHSGAREDAHRLAGHDVAGEGAARRALANHSEAGRHVGAGAHGVTVHRRGVEGRLIATGDHCFGQGSA